MSINLGGQLSRRADIAPNLDAFIEPSTDTALSYRELNEYSNRCAGVLTGLGYTAGDRVALLLQNSVEFLGLFYGAAKMGLVVVPLNTRLTAPELAFILSNSGAKALFFGESFADLIKPIKGNKEHDVSALHCIATHSNADDGLEALLAKAPAEEPPITHGDKDNLFIMYTSGTTGLPKGVVHTHASMSWSSISWATTMDVRYQDRVLLPLPMFHVAALTTVIMCCVRGLSIISMPQFDPNKVWSLIREQRVNLGGSVPAILNFMRQSPEFENFESPDLRCFVTGAAPMPKALIELYASKGFQVVQGYALTETGGGGSFLLPDDAIEKAGSAGKAGMFGEVRVLDDNGDVGSTGTGEVVIQAPYLLKEYWNRPDATKEAFVDGWFRTGDIAEIDSEGFIWIKDRIKDMIISGGENIYPAEIENVILSHADVQDAAVIGLDDERWGEIVCAVIVGNADNVSEEQLIAFCGEKLARYKLPRKVIFVDELPRNPAGKVLKRVLRDECG